MQQHDESNSNGPTPGETHPNGHRPDDDYAPFASQPRPETSESAPQQPDTAAANPNPQPTQTQQETQNQAQLDRAALERLYRRGVINLDTAKRGAAIIKGEAPIFTNNNRNAQPGRNQNQHNAANQRQQGQHAQQGQEPGTASQDTHPSPQDGQSTQTQGAWKRLLHTLRQTKGQSYYLGPLLKDCDPNSVKWDGTTLHATFKNDSIYERFMEETVLQEPYAAFQTALEKEFGPQAQASLKSPGSDGNT